MLSEKDKRKLSNELTMALRGTNWKKSPYVGNLTIIKECPTCVHKTLSLVHTRVILKDDVGKIFYQKCFHNSENLLTTLLLEAYTVACLLERSRKEAEVSNG